MFHIVFSIASRFLVFGNVLQRLARGILALRNLGVVSHFIPTLSPPPPILLLDAAAPFVELPEIISPYPSVDLILIERTERPSQVFSSPIPSYQSSLIPVTPGHLPNPLPLFIALALISGFVILLPEIVHFSTSVAEIPSISTHASGNIFKFFRFKPISSLLPARIRPMFTSRLLVSLVSLLLLWTGLPAIAPFFTFIWIMSILLSQDQGWNVIVIVLQWCGILAVQDTQTPPLLNAIYEQFKRAAAGYNDLVGCSDLSHVHDEDQAITDCSLCSHLAALATKRGRDHPDAMQRKNQEREAHDEQTEKHRLWVQHIYTQFVASQNGLRRQLELSRAREQKLHADLLAAEQGHESLKELLPNLRESNKKRRGWEKTAANAKARCAEAEITVSNLRADLTAAMDHVRNIQEQLDCQAVLLSGKDRTIQSITEESQVAHVKLKNAENKIAGLNAKLQRSRDRHRKTKEQVDEQVRVQDRHESEMRRLTQEAQNAQEQLDILEDELSRLRADRQSTLDHGAPPTSSTNPDSSPRLTKSSPYIPIQDQEDSPTLHVVPLLKISAFSNMESENSRDQREALLELIERKCQREFESAKDAANPNGGRDESLLREELAVTKEKLRVAEEEVLTMRDDLGQSSETLREVKAHIRCLQAEWDMCQAMLREEQGARCTSMIELLEVVELLHLSQTESESLKEEAEQSQFRCSQLTFLCAALRERVTELEAKVKKSAPPDVEAITQVSDSIYMTVPPLPYILDLSLPPSLSSDVDLSYTDSQLLDDLSLALQSCDVPDTSPDISPNNASPRISSSAGYSFGSMDWPPIGSSLLPTGANVRKDSDIGVQADGNLGKGRRPSHRFSRPREIPRLDYGLRGDFVPSVGRIVPERQANHDNSFVDDFAFVIPLDCRTSTPVASRKRSGLPSSGGGLAALAGHSHIQAPHPEATECKYTNSCCLLSPPLSKGFSLLPSPFPQTFSS